MNTGHHRSGAAPLPLQESCIYLARDGAMRSYAKTPRFLRHAGRDPAFKDGRILAFHHVNGPDDVHYPVWEMHCDGDELLLLISGAVSVEFREEEGGRAVPLSAQAAFIVPAGAWHRLVVHEPSVLMAITPRHNTLHEKA